MYLHTGATATQPTMEEALAISRAEQAKIDAKRQRAPLWERSLRMVGIAAGLWVVTRIYQDMKRRSA